MVGIVQLMLFGLLALAASAPSPQQPPNVIPIIRQEQDGPNPPDGNYRYSFETGNGITADEQGAVQNLGSESEALAVNGQSSYTSPEGQVIRLVYVAGPQGFVPQGDHLPTPPPIPAAIQRALEYIAANPSPPENAAPGRRF